MYRANPPKTKRPLKQCTPKLRTPNLRAPNLRAPNLRTLDLRTRNKLLNINLLIFLKFIHF